MTKSRSYRFTHLDGVKLCVIIVEKEECRVSTELSFLVIILLLVGDTDYRPLPASVLDFGLRPLRADLCQLLRDALRSGRVAED